MPVTEYVSEVDGLTVIEFPFAPLLHSKFVPAIFDETFRTVFSFIQITGNEAVSVSIGSGFTVIVA